jgi:CheY-like chemotaxis protein
LPLVRLPPSQEAPDPLAAKARKGFIGQMPGQKKYRILCVSHSPHNLQLILAALPSRGYVGLAATTPEQAVAFCVSHSVAAVVLDSEFTTEHGWSAAQTLKGMNPRLPVLLLEAGHNGNVPTGVDGVAATVSHILEKLNLLLRRAS